MTQRERWSVAEAKARFSELIAKAQLRPQVVENRGSEVAIVISVQEYTALKEKMERSAPETRLGEFLRFSEGVRREGGGELKPTKRVARPTPFADEGED